MADRDDPAMEAAVKGFGEALELLEQALRRLFPDADEDQALFIAHHSGQEEEPAKPRRRKATPSA